MEIHPPPTDNPVLSSSLYDWGDLLDFIVDDQLPLSFDSIGPTASPQVDNNNNNNSDCANATSVLLDIIKKRYC